MLRTQLYAGPADAALRHLYNDEVPVVFINGRKAFKYHMDEQEFLRKLVG